MFFLVVTDAKLEAINLFSFVLFAPLPEGHFRCMAIELKEAINILKSGDWCRLRFTTAHIKKGTGGQVIDLPKCRIARRQPAATAAGVGKSASSHTKKRDANHNGNATLNVELLNKSIVTVHIILILMINDHHLLRTSQNIEQEVLT